MATERQAPDALISSTGFSACALADLTSDPDSGDASWCVASDNNTNTETHTSFGSPTGDPTVGADLQEFRAEVRQFDGGQTGTPTARIELWENGTLVRAGSEVNVTSAASQVVSFTWNANELGTADGSLVECKVIGTKAGGSPSARNAVDVGGVEWNVTYDEAGSNVTGSGSPQADTATASGAGVNIDSGSGAPQAATATASGAGVNVNVGTGTPQAATATASGAGLNTNIGSGSPQATTATASGAGTVTGPISGSGSPQAATATASGVGINTHVGAGAPQAGTATASGDGTVTGSVTGSGGPQAATATASGSGNVIYVAFGSPQADRATASGVGTVTGGKVFRGRRMRIEVGMGM